MRRYHLRQLLRDSRVSRFEEHSFITGLLLIVAAVVMAEVRSAAPSAGDLRITTDESATGL